MTSVICAIDVLSIPAGREANVHLNILVQDLWETWFLSITTVEEDSLVGLDVGVVGSASFSLDEIP
jgi:hypothetical protein